MRILLAVDGSRSADQARDLVAALPFREGGRVRIVSVASTGAGPVGAGSLDDEILGVHRDALTTAEREIHSARSDLVIEPVLVRGRPASVIVDQARDMEADLIVLGHRGRGRWESGVLGSVAGEVVDQAGCPVLIARDERLGPVVLAGDGSPNARTAEGVVSEWPLFSGLRVTVVTVAEDDVPFVVAIASVPYDESVNEFLGAPDADRRSTRETCEAAAGRLREAGVEATGEVREGDPAQEIIACAREHGAGLIVVGTRGMTGLRRLILGSVARKVMLHAACSVLVVREGARLDGRRIERRREARELVTAFG